MSNNREIPAPIFIKQIQSFGSWIGCVAEEASPLYKDLFLQLTRDSSASYSFFDESFENHPVVFKSPITKRADDSALFLSAFSLQALISILNSQKPLHAQSNLKCVRYSASSKKENAKLKEPLSPKQVARLMLQDGYTVQFYQPQRFSDPLHRLNAAFEHTFGALAGSSAYLTPPQTQGLAPHYDDVEVFVFQTEGTKLWRLWSGGASISRLPETCSGDIRREDLFGACTEVLLCPGDVLYVPRGTIHEAIALDCFSTHVTISVYQKYNLKRFLSAMLPPLLEKAFEQDMLYRKGLPPKLSSAVGSFASLVAKHSDAFINKNSSSGEHTAIEATDGSGSGLCHRRVAFKNQLADALSHLSRYITDDVIDEAADELLMDFVTHRLPPPHRQIEGETRANAVTVSSAAKRWQKRLQCDARTMRTLRSKAPLPPELCVRICDPDEMHSAVIEDDGVATMLLWNSRFNSRLRHMGHPIDGYVTGEEADGESVETAGSGDCYKEARETLRLPLRLAPVVIWLQHARKRNATDLKTATHSSGVDGIEGKGVKGRVTMHELCDALKASHRLFRDEVEDVVRRLVQSGFVDFLLDPNSDHLRVRLSDNVPDGVSSSEPGLSKARRRNDAVSTVAWTKKKKRRIQALRKKE